MFTNLVADPDRPPPDALERFLRLTETAIARAEVVRFALSQGCGPDASLERVLIRPLTLRGQPHLQLVYRHTTRDITKNHPLPDALGVLRELLGAQFRHAHLQTPREDVQLSIRSKGGRDKSQLRIGRLAAPARDAATESDAATPASAGPGHHNREKQYLVDPALPCWVDLGLAGADGRLIPSMARKWRQINKFTEIFAGALRASPLAQRDAAQPVRVMDFGCGKGYLTFAVHAWLVAQQRRADVVGVELRQELVDLCQAAVVKHRLEGLRFDAGDVREYVQQADLDVMIALHACDIATDHAIHFGLQAGASIILCSPCCHKQIRPQIHTPAPLRPLLQHGIHLGQEAEMVTDSLRALLLDAAGYDTQVFEFVSLEHTNKNKMILAVRRARPDPARQAEMLAQVEQVKNFYGIREHCLQTLIQNT